MRKAVFSYWLTVLLVISLMFSSFAAETTATVAVKRVTQEKSNWCWAASSVSAMYHYNKSVTQSQFVKKVKGNTNNVGGSVANVKAGLKAYGLSSSNASALTFTQVKQDINASRPIIAGWKWNTNGGHMVVVNGWDTGTGKEKYVQYMDPFYGKYYSVLYSTLKSNTKYYWSESVYQIKKI